VSDAERELWGDYLWGFEKSGGTEADAAENFARLMKEIKDAHAHELAEAIRNDPDVRDADDAANLIDPKVDN